MFDLCDFLNMHYRQLPGGAGVRLMLYIAFVQRFVQKFALPWRESELEGLLPRLFVQVPGYEIKEAAVIFDAAMPWSLLHRSPALQRELNALNQSLYKSRRATPDWLRRQTDRLFALENPFGAELTPESVRALVAALAAQHKPGQLIELCSGTAQLGLQVWHELGRDADIPYRGEELNHDLCAFSRLFLFLCNMESFSIIERNVMEPLYEAPDDAGAPKVYLSDLPLTGSRTIPVCREQLLAHDKPINTLYADWYLLQNIFHRMRGADRAFILVTKGALVRQNEAALRRYIIEQDWLDAVVHLPAGLYAGHPLPVELLVCQKTRPADRRQKVLFADLGPLAGSNQHKRMITPEALDSLAEVYRQFADEPGLARVTETAQIRQNRFSLYPPVYVAGQDAVADDLHLGEVAQVTRGLQNTKELPQQAERYLLNIRNLQNGTICYEEAEQIEVRNPEWEYKYRIREDDIIITCKGAKLKLAIVPPNPPPAYISGNLTLIRAMKEKYPPYLLYEYLLSEQGQRALEMIQTGTTIRILGSSNLARLPLPRYEQQTAAKVGEGLKQAALRYEEALTAAATDYQTDKKNLLNKLQRK